MSALILRDGVTEAVAFMMLEILGNANQATDSRWDGDSVTVSEVKGCPSRPFDRSSEGVR